MTRWSWWIVAGSLLVGCKTDEPADVAAPTAKAPAPVPTPADAPAKPDSGGANVFACSLDVTGRHDCVVSTWGCEHARKECEERPEAWCFPSTFTWRDKKFPSTPCAIDRAECERWHQQRLDHPEPPTGPCALTQPRDYVDTQQLILNAR